MTGFAWAPSLDLSVTFYVDGLSLAFGLLVSGIGALVVVYTGAYMEGPARGRFLAYLFAFMGSMLGLVFADNLVLLFVFWEATSITSYLLIGFDKEREAARNAARQALLVTGVGGLALLAGAVLLGEAAGTYSVRELLSSGTITDHPHYTAIVLLMLLAAFTKSAQFPFHFWLASAMEAPTPASAFLHSATMVKAGIYLVARLTPVLGGGDLWFGVLVGGGGLTMVISAWLALQQTKLKPLLAYTTVVALGTLMLCLGLGTPVAVKAAMVFLFVHALYKAALFMVAGAVQHAAHEKDSEHLGGLWRKAPTLMAAAAVSGLSMAGLPPLFGFIGKEAVYEAALYAPVARNVVVAVAIFANMANVFVAILVAWRPFWGRPAPSLKMGEFHGVPPGLWAGPLILGALGLYAGLFPEVLGKRLLADSGFSILNAPLETKLKLWHGWNVALLLSLVTVTLGLLAFLIRRWLRRMAAHVKPLRAWGPAVAYEHSITGLFVVARGQTRLLQHGLLRYYLLAVFACTLLLPGWMLIRRGVVDFSLVDWDVQLHEALLCATVVMAALAATRVRTPLSAAACLGGVGYGTALLYGLLSAPDIAMTQFIVESLLVLFFVLAVARMPRPFPRSSMTTRLRDGAVAIGAGTVMAALTYCATLPGHPAPMRDFYTGNSVSGGHGRNIVNVILVDFRALDTLGEITVLAVAAVGVLALLKTRKHKKVREADPRASANAAPPSPHGATFASPVLHGHNKKGTTP
ncbi:MAG: hydrogen gas-evolving membrane-bound hydrogenase subunit E [Candidatus Hydrogenedentota bacterium]